MSQSKSRTLAILLAFTGVLIPGLHKFYLGKPGWGATYLLPGLLFSAFPFGILPRVASVIEGISYLMQPDEFDRNFNSPWGVAPVVGASKSADPARIEAMAQALRQLESLRQEGLISEYEFEQQRRQLLQ